MKKKPLASIITIGGMGDDDEDEKSQPSEDTDEPDTGGPGILEEFWGAMQDGDFETADTVLGAWFDQRGG